MRHFLRAPASVGALAGGMVHAAAPRPLVPGSRPVQRVPARLAGTRRPAVALATIATAAKPYLLPTTRTQEQAI